MSKVVRINANSGSVSTEELKKEYMLFGNRGLIAKVMSDEVDPKCDPMGAENKLIVCTGLLAGTPFPTGHRLSVGGKSPLTKGIKESNVGGTVATFLAQHGIKMLIIEDKPESVKWKLIHVDKGGNVGLVDADNYVGLNNYALIEKLYESYGKDVAILSIGVAGERGYKNSTLQSTDFSTGHPARSAGRGGLGAIAGSKKIKAIIIEKPTTKAKIKYADEKMFKEAQKRFVGITLSEKNAMTQNLVKYGTCQIIDTTSVNGVMPVKNFSGDYYPPNKLKKLKSDAWLKKLKKNDGKAGLPCQAGCIIKCSNVFNDSKGKFVTAGLEYETAVLAGPNCDINDWDYLAKFDKLCDDFGIDTMETGNTIAVCMEAGRIK
jgi:aldehyde:ferredoxin oxidoreductase